MEPRRDDGYQVRLRLQVRPNRRRRLVLVATAAIATAWLAVTLSSRPGPVAVATPPPTGVPDPPPVPTVRPTLPPAIEAFEGAPTAPVAAMGRDGLTWLDPRDGSMLPASRAGWMTLLASLGSDGTTTCVCVGGFGAAGGPESDWHLRRYEPSGRLLSDLALHPWPAPNGSRVISAGALHPAGRVLYLAAAAEQGDGWSVRLRRLAMDGSGDEEIVVGEPRLAGLPPGSQAALRLWIALDGRHARIRLAGGPDIPTAAFLIGRSRTWNVPLTDAGFGRPERVEPPLALPGSWCFAEGWAAPTSFLAACVSPRLDSGNLALGVLTDAVDGTTALTTLGAYVGDVDWLLDAASGDAFLWEPGAHRLRRLNVASLQVTERVIPPADVRSGRPTNVAPWPRARDGNAAWQPRVTEPLPPGFGLRLIAGSPDGSVIYAAGYDVQRASPSSPRGAPTGLWVFDAATLEVVARWAPAGRYESLAVTADGRSVIALGGPVEPEFNAFGDQGRTIAFHDASSGALTLVLRRVPTEGLFLVPEPDW